ncbi:MAG: hypothetical protein COW63_18975 [Bacteroidetes bacterium CG18_big_fil_WC_8_21_14_2_50_41_14]|nr:MAG: hypothetical protein COW63_18975 [Bacteroidetes bacterium CG18_big_fil_WC_8_21_14_2_50_41_14]PJB57509.1 MAG: hypothetical protein CO098_11275 [Bacteroidetes bacterium CG_4_9_14_3_um_filter_41_19]
MKKLIISAMFILFMIPFYGQQDSALLFNEFRVSINSNGSFTPNTNEKFGFGVGAYHTLKANEMIDALFGFEYNQTSQYLYSMYEGHVANSTDLTYTFHSFSIPITARTTVGRKVKFFVDSGAFVDFILAANRKGTMHTYSPDENGQVVYREFDFSERVKVSFPIFGVSVGIGIKIPLLKHEFLVRTEYKYGINAISKGMDSMYNRYYRFSIGYKL